MALEKWTCKSCGSRNFFKQEFCYYCGVRRDVKIAVEVKNPQGRGKDASCRGNDRRDCDGEPASGT